MSGNSTVRTLAASLAALLLMLSTFAGGAAATGEDNGDKISDVAEEKLSTTNCLQVYIEEQAGPATVTYNCGASADVDEDWDPRDEAEAPASGPPCSMDPNETYVEAGPVTVYKGPFCEPYPEYDEDWEPSVPKSTTKPECSELYGDSQVGPVTVTVDDTCRTSATVNESWSPVSETTDVDPPQTSPPNCLYIYYERQAGPVTVVMSSSCSGSVEVDEEWRPSLSSTDDDSSPSDEPVKCTLDANDNREIFYCIFGKPW
jgi:hypothetical protein